MKLCKITYKTFFITLFLICSTVVFSQSNKQKALETRRNELRNEIQKINELRLENKSKQKSQLYLIEDFSYKISVLNNLIKVTNQQTNLLTYQISDNQKKISSLRDELKQLKEDYAAMIVKSYKSKNEQSRIMFLLSSNDFKQAYKRLQYLKQYSEYQKEKGETIKLKTLDLQKTNIDLQMQKVNKKKLIAENRVVQKSLEEERRLHQSVMRSIKSNLSKYTAQIREKQREADKIDWQINDIIRAVIAKSNKRAGKSSSVKTFALTAAGKALAKNFESNKGKLGWPVDKGVVKLRYGTQPHPINRTLTIKSNGVRIATEKKAKVHVVFKGKVTAVIAIKNANTVVMVQHGNYFTAYKNLGKVYVKKGDQVTTNQEIGEVFTNPRNGESILSFSVFKESTTQNPAGWIYKM